MQEADAPWADYFLPKEWVRSAEGLKKHRILVFVCFLTSFLAFVFFVISWLVGFAPGVFAMATSSALMFVLPFVIRAGANREFIANVYIGAIFIDTVVVTALSGGISQSITATYIPIVPMLAVMLINQRAGFIWFFVATTEILTLGLLEVSGVDFPTMYDIGLDAVFELAALLGMVVIVFFIVRNFDNTAQGALRQVEEEQEKTEGLLLNILPAEVADELKATGVAEAREFDAVTILFSDFQNFTEISAGMTPQELVSELNVCFNAFDAIMESYHLEKVKTIGDAYMAASGLPQEQDSQPVDMIFAALDMQRFLARHREIRDEERRPSFVMRVGIHTGPVVAGIVGVKKFQYDIWGDTVNTASRMESSGVVGQVNISEATYELVKDEPRLSFTPRGSIEVKGKGELKMFFVRNIANPPPSPAPTHQWDPSQIVEASGS